MDTDVYRSSGVIPSVMGTALLNSVIWFLQSRDPAWVPRLGFCPSTGLNPGLLIGLLTGHNTLRRHLHLLGLPDSPLYRCGVKEENSAHILCECEALASFRHVYLGSFFLKPEDIKSISLGAIWNFGKVIGLPWIDMGHKGPVTKA
jgi:hypothetical protein